jgi:hypothetical protein
MKSVDARREEVARHGYGTLKGGPLKEAVKTLVDLSSKRLTPLEDEGAASDEDGAEEPKTLGTSAVHVSSPSRQDTRHPRISSEVRGSLSGDITSPQPKDAGLFVCF